MKNEEKTRSDNLHEERLLPLVYAELRRMAAVEMRKERLGHTLQPTALVHEAWLRLKDTGGNEWENKAHFFGAAGRAMRRILVDHARRRSAGKRNAPEQSPELNGDYVRDDVVLMINESLDHLEKEDPDAAKIVILKFFAGMDSREIARATGSSLRSVERQWTLTKARLYQIISINENDRSDRMS